MLKCQKLVQSYYISYSSFHGLRIPTVVVAAFGEKEYSIINDASGVEGSLRVQSSIPWGISWDPESGTLN